MFAGNGRGALGLSLLLLWSGSGAALAQETAPPAESPEAAEARVEEELFVEASLPYVPSTSSVATKLPMDLAWTPANVGVLDLGLLAEQDGVVMGDLLGQVSGMLTQTGGGVFDYFTLRGYDSLNGSLLAIDGVSEPESAFYPLYNLERIEVFKGPASFLYGSNALAGTVNLVRKQPLPLDFATLELSGGSFGELGGALDTGLASADGKLSFRLNGTWREGDGYRDGRESELWAVNPALSWRPSEATSVSFNAEVGTSETTPDAGQPLIGGELPNIPRRRSFNAASDFSTQDLTRFQVDVEHRFGSGLVLRNKAYYRELDWQTAGTLLFGAFEVPFFGAFVSRGRSTLDDQQTFVGNQLELVKDFDTGSVEHRLLAGVELQRAEDDYALGFRNLSFVDLEGRPAPLPIFGVPFPVQRGETRADVVAPYVMDRIKLGYQWQVLVGARFDSIDFEDAVSGTERSDSELSPMLGVTYMPRPGTALYANASRAFAPPSPRVTGEREPEESQQLELGLRQALLQGRLQATLALFEIERDNLAIPDDNGFTQQAGDQRSRGVELELAGELTPQLSMLLSYAYTDSELTRFAELVQTGLTSFVILDRSGNQAAFAPEQLARLWFSYRLPAGFRVGAGLRHVGDHFVAEDNVAEIGAYTLFDASLSYQKGDWRVGIHGFNLSEEEYETRAFGSASVIPGEPASVQVRVAYRLPLQGS